MGAGKTTVIAPILALMLGDKKTCVVQVVPSSLLEMTRSVMRSRFSSLVHKPVYTFVFDRADVASEEVRSLSVKTFQTAPFHSNQVEKWPES